MTISKCKRCVYFICGESLRQFCPELDCYVDLCHKCKTPEKMAREYKLSGAVF